MVVLRGFAVVLVGAVLATAASAQDLRPKPRPQMIERAANASAPATDQAAGAVGTAKDAQAPIHDPMALTEGLPFVFAAAAPSLRPGLRTAAPAAPVGPANPAPAPRGAPVTSPEPLAAAVATIPTLRPPRRPAAPPRATPPSADPAGAGGLARSLRPKARPVGLARSRPAVPGPEQAQPAAILRPAPGTGPVAGAKGSVCGSPSIQGQRLSPIVGRIAGCGIKEPVRVTSVAGVRLSQAATLNCATAQALERWIERGLKPAFGRSGGGVVALTVPAHYACRTRNHKKGAKLSEHARGNAVDISVIHLANGQQVSVLRGWRGEYGQMMRAAHKAACGIFSTTLGPGSDGMHEDHFHYDIARHRSGSYCR